MSTSQSHVVIINDKGSFCHGSVRVLLTPTDLAKLLQARGSVSRAADLEVFDWGCQLLQQFPLTKGKADQYWSSEVVEGYGLFIPHGFSNSPNNPIPQMGTTPAAFGWEAWKLVCQDLLKLNQFMLILHRDLPSRLAITICNSLHEITTKVSLRKLDRIKKLTIKPVEFADRFVDSTCYFVYGKSSWQEDCEGFAGIKDSIGEISTARAFPSVRAAQRLISSCAWLDRSSCVILQGTVRLNAICPETSTNVVNVPGVRNVLAVMNKRAIQDGLEQASIEELKERLAFLEAAQAPSSDVNSTDSLLSPSSSTRQRL